MTKIAIDIDGVIADFVGAFRAVAKEQFDLMVDDSVYGLGITSQQWGLVYDWMIDLDVFVDLKAYEGAWSWIRSLTYNGLQPTYLTRRRPFIKTDAREYHHQRQTKLWLVKQGFDNASQVEFVQDKFQYCDEHGIEVLVEDYLPDASKWNYRILRNGRHFRVLLLDRPWNQGDYAFRYRQFPPAGVMR